MSLEQLQQIQNSKNPSGDNQPIKLSEFLQNEAVNSGIETTKPLSYDYVDPKKTGQYGFDITKFGTKLSDGSYSYKFDEGVLTSETPEQAEERYASKQSTLEKWSNGLIKASTKVGLYATDALAGTAYGLVNAVSEGSLNALYDNDFAHYLDDLNTELDNSLPNYYSEYEKEANFFQSLGTANFWANDFAGGLAFLGGTVLSEGVLAMATGGGSLATTLPRLGLKSAAKVALKKGLKEGAETVGKRKILKEVIKAQKEGIVRRGVIGEGLDLTGFAFRSSIYEAGMEARHAAKESVDNYIANYINTYGEEPSGEELQSFINDAKNSANGVFAANVAILAPSNLLMFGKLGNKGIKQAVGGSKANKFFFGIGSNPIKGEGGKLTYEAIKPTKLQKVSGSIYTKLQAPVTEGLWEEGLQGVASKTMTNYLNDKYNSRNNIENLSLMNSFYDAFAEQYGTSAGWKENLLGSMIGMVGGTFTSFTRGLKGGVGNAARNTEGLAGFGKQSYKSLLEQNKEDINALNKATATYFDRVNNLSNLSENIKRSNIFTDENKGSYTESKTADIGADWSYISSMSYHKSQDEILDDYKFAIENMELSEEDSIKFGISKEQFESYKKDKVGKFTKRLDSAIKAKKAIQYLSPNFNVTEGNQKAIEDALSYNIYAGSESLENVNELASELESIVGKEGLKSSFTYYTNLSNKQKESIDEIKNLQKELDELKEKSLKLAKVRNLSSFNSEKNRLESFREKEAEKNFEIVSLQDEINTKEAELEQMKQSASLKIGTGSVSFNKIFGLTDGFSDVDITKVIQDLDTIDSYAKSLELEGNVSEAKALESLTAEIKFNLDNARETVNLYEQMLDPSFLKRKGLSKLVSTIIGDKYKMSEDTVELIKSNSEKVRRSLDLANIQQPTEESIEEYIKKIIEEADHLSDRNKFHLEMAIRNIIKAKDLEFTIPTVPGTVSEPVVVTNGIPRSGVRLKEVEVDLSSNPTLEYVSSLIEKIIESSDQLSSLIGRKNPKIEKLKSQILVIEQLENQINIEKELEVGEQRNIDEWTLELEKLKSEFDSDLNKLETELKEEIEKDKGSEFQPTTKEYNRFNKLIKESQNRELSIEEKEELEDLREFIDQWIKIDGTVADGVSLSSLLEQQAILENYVEESVSEVINQSNSEIFESDKSVSINATQSFNNVFSILHKGKLEITGLTFSRFVDLIKPLNRQSLSSTPKQGEVIELELDQGVLKVEVDEFGIKISKDQIDLLNTSPLNFINTSSDLNTNYNVVLDENLQPLKSDFPQEYVGGEINEIAIYDSEIGEEVELVVNLEDDHNKELLKGVSTKQLTEEEIEDEIAEDSKIIELNDAVYRVELQLESRTLTTSKKHDFLKRKQKLKDSIVKREEVVRKNLTSKTLTKEETNSLKEKLKKGLSISVYTKKGKEGDFTGVLKSKRESEIISVSKDKFNSMRDHLVEKYFDEIISGKETVRLLGEKVSVQGIYLGQPRYNYNREGGKIVTEYKNILNKQVDKILDIGFIEGGKITTKNGTKDVNSTYVDKVIKKSKKVKGKTGIVVLQHGKHKIYYPVNTNNREVSFSEQLTEVYQGAKPSKELAIQLNEVIEAAGLNPKKEGFVFVTEKANGNNINDENFNNIIAKIKQKDYFYDMNEWVEESSNMNHKITTEMNINIDLNNPFFSPKLELNFSEIDVPLTKSSISPPKPTGQQGSSKLDSILGC